MPLPFVLPGAVTSAGMLGAGVTFRMMMAEKKDRKMVGFDGME